MERSRSKRGYNYDPDSSPPPPPRSRPRYNDNRRRPNHHHRRGGSDDRRPQPPPPPPPFVPPAVGTDGGPPPGAAVTTFYRILCPDYKCEELLGEPIAQIQAQTHAWITVHRPAPGDSERVIETSDNVRREPDGRPPQFSPAQDALLLVHRKIVDMPDHEDVRNRDRERGDDEDGLSKVTSRMVIPRLHVGCLLGRGGHIIEQMRKETKTHIRILPRDHNTPGCVSMSEEILQVKP